MNLVFPNLIQILSLLFSKKFVVYNSVVFTYFQQILAQKKITWNLQESCYSENQIYLFYVSVSFSKILIITQLWLVQCSTLWIQEQNWF